MEINSRDFIFVTGKAYSGKTFFIRAHIEAIPETRHVLIYDFTDEYRDLATRKNVDVWVVKTGLQEEAEEFISMVYAEGNCTAILSESDNYLKLESAMIRQFVTTGRNRGINAIIDGKRPFAVVPDYRGRFNKLVLFKTTLPDDIEYLEKWAGVSRGSLQELTQLEQGEFIIVDLDSQEISPVKKL